MKKTSMKLLFCILLIALVFFRNNANSQNNDDTKSIFGSVMSVGNTLYIPIIKTLVPADSTPLSPDTVYQSTEREYVIRAIDFFDPHNPVEINDMDIGIDIDQYPQLYLSISDKYIYSFNGELDTGGYLPPEDSPYGEAPSEEAKFTIFEIQNNQDIIIKKDLPLTNILDTVRKDQNELLQGQLLTVTDNRAYLILNGISMPEPMPYPYPSEVLPGSYPTSIPEPMPSSYPSEAMVYSPLPDEEINEVGIEAYSNEKYIPVASTYSYAPWKPENNTIIVTVDITNPSDAMILDASRVPIASPGANVDMEAIGNIGYLVVSSLDSKDTFLYVLDLVSPEKITVKNSITLFGDGGQMAREGNNLYIAAQDFGLEIVDISDPLNPELIGWLETPHPLTGMYGSAMGGERNIVVKNDYAYIIQREDGLLVIDVSDPGNPQLAGSYLSEYITSSSVHSFYAPYTSIDNAGDYLFLREMGSIDILSIANPEDPVSVGIFGVREAGILMLALRLESAGLVEIITDEAPEGDIALFGIPSLDTLSRKYGVLQIIQANQYPMYYMPYLSSPTEALEPSVEDIKKDRDLRTYYLSFPASVRQNEIIADYLENPYVITAEVGMPEVYGPYGYSGSSYAPMESSYAYPISEPVTGTYGGIYDGSYSGGLYSSGQISGYPTYYGPGGTYTDLSYPTVPYPGPGPMSYVAGYDSYANIPSTSGYPTYYGYSGLGMLGGLATSYPLSTLYGSGVYGGFGRSGSYSGLMSPLSASTPMPELNIYIGEINIEGGVTIGELNIGSEPSNTPELTIALFPDVEPPREPVTYASDDITSSADAGLPGNEYSLNNLWTGNQDKSSSFWWNDWSSLSSNAITANFWTW